MDEGDYAADYQARLNAEAVSRHRQAMARAAGETGSETCEDCGEAIPAKRRELAPGCRRCVSCQAAAEKLQGRRDDGNA